MPMGGGVRCPQRAGLGANRPKPDGDIELHLSMVKAREQKSASTESLRLRAQRERVNGRSWQEWCRLASHPRVMSGTIKWRQGMGALPAGHVENPFVLMAGRDDETLAGAMARALDARHVGIT